MKKLYLLSTLMLVMMMVVMIPQKLSATSFTTNVTSFGTYDFSGKHFCILSYVENISSDDVEFKEYAKYISYAFQLKGGIEVSPQSEEAEICILLSYDIKDASYIRTVSEPVWGQTTVSSVTAHENLSGGTSYDYSYNRGVVGYKQSEQKVNLFVRYIDLFVYELPTDKNAEHKMVWKAYAKSEGYRDNLYYVFPAMAYSLTDYIGITTARYKKVSDKDRIYEDNIYYKLFEQGKLHRKNITTCPLRNIVQNPKKNGTRADIIYIVKNRKSTVICVYLYGKTKLFRNTYIEYDHQKYPLKAMKRGNAIDGSTTAIPISDNQNNVIYNTKRWLYGYFMLYFPPLPENAYVIDILSNKSNDKKSSEDLIWKEIQLRN